MEIVNKKLTEATRKELYKKWVNEGWDRMMPFEEYVYRLQSAGVEVKEDK